MGEKTIRKFKLDLLVVTFLRNQPCCNCDDPTQRFSEREGV